MIHCTTEAIAYFKALSFIAINGRSSKSYLRPVRNFRIEDIASNPVTEQKFITLQ